MLIEFLPTFKYFSTYTKWNTNQNILDFGSNCGNLLKSCNGAIIENQYTGIDVDLDSIQDGKINFPDAKWVWYNRYNPVYNKNGKDVLPELDNTYDLIVSYSVFSHTTESDMVELVDYLYNQLLPGGTMLFTYCNVDNAACVEWFRARRVDCDIIPRKNVVYLANNKVSDNISDENCINFVTFYKENYILDVLKKYNPLSLKPTHGWFQHCIKISK
jgi:SAM-dependent methyltransferase